MPGKHTYCEKEQIINELMNVVFGKEGLNETVVRLDESVKGVTKALEGNAVAIRGLLEFMNETKGRDSLKVTVRWLVGIIITVILAYTTLLIKFIE